MTKLVVVRETPSGEICAVCECEITLVMGDGDMELAVVCDCGSSSALVA